MEEEEEGEMKRGVCVYECVWRGVCMCVCVGGGMCACVHTCMHVYVSVRACVCLRACVCVCESKVSDTEAGTYIRIQCMWRK